MSTSLDELDSRFRPIAEALIGRCRKAGIPVAVITTGRTIEAQKLAVAHGVSWTMKSKHLPQPPEGKSWAMDLCPTALLSEKNWAPKHPHWWILAGLAVELGLRSGMDWKGIGLPPVGQTRPSFDPGHVEWKGPASGI